MLDRDARKGHLPLLKNEAQLPWASWTSRPGTEHSGELGRLAAAWKPCGVGSSALLEAWPSRRQLDSPLGELCG